MGARTVIKHAHMQGVTLAKITDAPVSDVPMILALDLGMINRVDTVAPACVNLAKIDCSWCDGGVLAPVVFTTPGDEWPAHMCLHHARRYGRYVPQGAPVGGDVMLHGANGSWVSPVPRAELREMVTEALKRGQYFYASALSSLLHA